jgi:hypothetical protein
MLLVKILDELSSLLEAVLMRVVRISRIAFAGDRHRRRRHFFNLASHI